MLRLISWLTQLFNHPLSPLFFILGAVLVVLGISDGLPIANTSQLNANDNFRYVSVAIGVVSLLASIFTYYKPLHNDQKNKHEENIGHGEMQYLPEDMKISLEKRRKVLSPNQWELLEHIEKTVGLSYKHITEEFTNIPSNELFYRLEQLRLLGFIIREELGANKQDASLIVYKLSEEYKFILPLLNSENNGAENNTIKFR